MSVDDFSIMHFELGLGFSEVGNGSRGDGPEGVKGFLEVVPGLKVQRQAIVWPDKEGGMKQGECFFLRE